MKIPKLKVGDPITADFINLLVDAANRANLSVGPNCGLRLIEGSDGMILAFAQPEEMWAKTTGPESGGTYPFTEQVFDDSGAWVDGPRSGDAYEVNGNASVPDGTFIKVERTSKGDYRFRSDTCS